MWTTRLARGRRDGGQPDPSYGAVTTPAARVAGRDARDALGLEPPDVHIGLGGEECSLPPHVEVFLGWSGRVPEPAGQLVVCSVHELLAVIFVLADEDDEGSIAVRVRRVLPPPAKERVVAPELLEVLVDAPGSVVLDEEHAAAIAVGPRHLQHRGGTDEPGAGSWSRSADQWSPTLSTPC
jgi:hypothetical protein